MTADDQKPAGQADEAEPDYGQAEPDGGQAEPTGATSITAPMPATPASAPATPATPGTPGTSSTRNYQAARRRFVRQVETSQRARRRRFVLIAVGALSVLTLLVSCGAWVVTTYISGALGRLDAGTSGTPSSGPVNILVVGIDTRGGLTQRQKVWLHVGSDVGENTDTMMLVHIPADHQSVQVVSLPRDSWVAIPGHGMNKINAAYGIGGPRLMVSTVEQATGLDINDYVEMDFLGFVKVINALGGVDVCLPYAVDDSDSGLHLSAGEHHVYGLTALKFARDRHSFATSDLARISDQQQLLSSAFTEATTSGVLANPVRLQQVLAAVTAAVQVDQGFNVNELADELRGLKPSDVTFTTVPLASVDYQTPTGESAVLWNQSAAAALFHWLQTDAGSPPPHGSPAGASTDAAPGGQHTAAQDACR
jgi:LCP family protein required for cell wall assembly